MDSTPLTANSLDRVSKNAFPPSRGSRGDPTVSSGQPSFTALHGGNHNIQRLVRCHRRVVDHVRPAFGVPLAHPLDVRAQPLGRLVVTPMGDTVENHIQRRVEADVIRVGEVGDGRRDLGTPSRCQTPLPPMITAAKPNSK